MTVNIDAKRYFKVMLGALWVKTRCSDGRYERRVGRALAFMQRL